LIINLYVSAGKKFQKNECIFTFIFNFVFVYLLKIENMKSNKEYIAMSLTIDADLKEKMDKMVLNKSRFINNLIKEQIKKEKNK